MNLISYIILIIIQIIFFIMGLSLLSDILFSKFNFGLFLAGSIYFLSALISFWHNIWPPLIIGFIFIWLLRIIGLETRHNIWPLSLLSFINKKYNKKEKPTKEKSDKNKVSYSTTVLKVIKSFTNISDPKEINKIINKDKLENLSKEPLLKYINDAENHVLIDADNKFYKFYDFYDRLCILDLDFYRHGLANARIQMFLKPNDSMKKIKGKIQKDILDITKINYYSEINELKSHYDFAIKTSNNLIITVNEMDFNNKRSISTSITLEKLYNNYYSI